MEYTITVTDEQNTALLSLCEIRNRTKDATQEDVTPDGLLREWALHPLLPRVEEARSRARAEMFDAIAKALTSDDADLRADAESLMTQIQQLATRTRQAPAKK